MSTDGIKALTFDTGGTILDWHTGFRTALADAGARHGIEQDWPALANELRRRSLGRMLNLPTEPYDHDEPDEVRAPWDAFDDIWTARNR